MRKAVYLTTELLLTAAVILGIQSGLQIKSAGAEPACSTIPQVSVRQLLDQTSQAHWQGYLENLTGGMPVMINGNLRVITNRFTPRLFDGSTDALAFLYIKEQLANLQYLPNSSLDHFGYYEHEYTFNGNNWKNLILTIPGFEQVDPRELILSAHLDDLPDLFAPGAQDDGVGAAALLEIARVLRYYQFGGTIKLIWFTGEEQGQRGSYGYVLDNTSFFDDLIGVINLDMFGFDADDDGCFEIHAGDLPDSYVLGDCLLNVIDAYNLPLAYDYIKAKIPAAKSDHLSFWQNNTAAIEILENQSGRQSTDAYQQCGDRIDANPNIHSENDKSAAGLNLPHAFNIIKASLALAATLSDPLGACFETKPFVSMVSNFPRIHLKWQNMGGITTYRVSRSLTGCGGPWQKLADHIYAFEYYDDQYPTPDLVYQVEAIAPSDTCISLPSNCVNTLDIFQIYLPIIEA